jgi:hypothetical protein
MKKRARRSGPGAKRAPKPRNPFALAARRRPAAAAPSPRAYRRRPKHKDGGESEE